MFSGGLALGGVTSALVLLILNGLLSPVPWGVRSPVVLAAAGLGILRDFRILRFPLPENRRLVPQDVFRNGPVWSALQFGFELGTGVRTYLPATSPYVLALAISLFGGSLLEAVTAGLAFALGRAVMPWMRYWAGDQDGFDGKLLARGYGLIRGCALITLLCVAVLVLGGGGMT